MTKALTSGIISTSRGQEPHKKGNDCMEFFGCLGIIAIFVAVWGLETWAVMALWNWVAVSMFGAPEVTFWMAAGAMLLLNLLTGGIKFNFKHN